MFYNDNLMSMQKAYIQARGLPFSTYAPRRRGNEVSYTIPLRITCKEVEEGVQIACKIVYVLNGRPPIVITCSSL